MMKGAVWLVEAGKKHAGYIIGGGICVDPRGLIFVSGHVVSQPSNNGYRILARNSKIEFRKAYLIRHWGNLDLSLVQVEKNNDEIFDFVNLEVANMDVGDRVYSYFHEGLLPFSYVSSEVSYPFSVEAALPRFNDLRTIRNWPKSKVYRTIARAFEVEEGFRTAGSVWDLGDPWDDYHPLLPLIQLSRPSLGGSSGCPVFTVEGDRFVGLVSFTKCGYTFLIPVTVVLGAYVSLGDNLTVLMESELHKQWVSTDSEDDEGDMDDHMLESLSRSKGKGVLGESSHNMKKRNRGGGGGSRAPNKRGRKSNIKHDVIPSSSVEATPAHRSDPVVAASANVHDEILNQVEFCFNDITSATTDQFRKYMIRDLVGNGYGSYRRSKEDRLLSSASCLDDTQLASAVLRTSSCVVGVVSLGVPAEMTRFRNGPRFLFKNQAFMGSGTIIECVEEAGDDGIKFFTTILTSSNLFTRSNGVQPSDIQVRVYLANGDSYNGDVLACDFHYNLAVVNIQSHTQLQTANLRDLDDDIISSIHVTSDHQRQSTVNSLTFQLHSHSSSFKIHPGDMVAALARSYSCDISVTSGRFRVDYPKLDCKELYSFVSSEHHAATTTHDYEKGRCLVEVKHWGLPNRGGPVINCHGEVIGIQAVDNYFLPSNIVSRWWNYYKKCKKFCRPWLGVKVANVQAANWHFLEAFVREFPTASSGIIVTKVVKNSAAYRSGLRSEDVIVQCSGATVRSTLDFFHQIWNKIGASVDIGLLRLVTGERINLTVTVDEPTPDNFYTWPIPDSVSRPVFNSDSQMSESSDSESRS